MQTHMHTHMRTHTHAQTHTHTHTYIHTPAHTHTFTHIHTPSFTFHLYHCPIFIFPIFISFTLVAPYTAYHFHLLHCIFHHLGFTASSSFYVIFHLSFLLIAWLNGPRNRSHILVPTLQPKQTNFPWYVILDFQSLFIVHGVHTMLIKCFPRMDAFLRLLNSWTIYCVQHCANLSYYYTFRITFIKHSYHSCIRY